MEAFLVVVLLLPSSSLAFNNTFSDRNLDLSFIGIDVGETFDRLLSPEGIVNQFALSIYLQIVYVTGYVLIGKYEEF